MATNMDSINLQRILAEALEHGRGMWRYRWWANRVAWAVFIVGWLVVCSLPNIYRASTRVFVDTNTLLKPLMRGLTVTDNHLDEVQLLSKAVLTRPNLERVAHSTDLALRARTPEDMEVLVTGLQRKVTVSGGRDNIFAIEYEDVSRDKAQAVVSALLDTFVESSMSTQGSDTQVTERALAGEIKNHEERLRTAEESLAKFKQDNLGYMPGQYGDYYKRLETGLATMRDSEERVHLLTERRDALKRQIEGEEPVFGIVATPLGVAGPSCPQGAQIQQLEGQLAALRVQFTDKHPRVMTLQETLARMREQCASQPSAAAGSATSAAPRPVGETLETNPVYQNLKIQYNTAEVDLAEARAQFGTSQKSVAELRRDVDKITDVETQLKQLNRDYDVVQGRHQEMLKRWEDLMAKKRLDPVTDNVLFRRIEPPFALIDPVGPNRAFLLAAVLAAALVAGLAVAFALNQLRPVYFTRASLGKLPAFPILGSISMILSPAALARRRAEAVVWGGACLALVFSYAVAVVFALRASVWLRGMTAGIGL